MKSFIKNCAIVMIVFVSSLGISVSVFAQAPDTAWTKTIGGADGDNSRSIQQTTDGGYVITGYTSSYGAGSQDVYLLKTDSLGDTLWAKTYGGSDWDESWAVQQTTDGGYIITGSTRSYGEGGYDVYLLKTDSLGDTLWTMTCGGSRNDYGYSAQQTSDGGYIVAGYTESYGAGGSDIYLIKIDSLGNTLWAKTYGGVDDDGGYSVQQTSDGGYIIVGITGSFGTGNEDIYLIKTDILGDTLWTRTYGGVGDDAGLATQQTTDGGYIVAGYIEYYGAGEEDVYLLKTDSLGDTLWTRIYGGGNCDEGWAVQQTTDGGYIVAGATNSYDGGYYDIYLIKTDILGDTLWTRTYGESDHDAYDKSYSVQQTTDGGYIVAGKTDSGGNYDFYIVKLKPEESGIEEDIKPNVFSISSPSQNPFTINTTVRYELPKETVIDISVYNIIGQEVKTLFSGRQASGVYSVSWDGIGNSGEKVSSGVYSLKIEAGDKEVSRKVMFVR